MTSAVSIHDGAVELSASSLGRLRGNIHTPSYERQAIRPGLLHIGLGNFHRAHQAVYLDQLLELGRGKDWGICGAGVRSADAHMRQALRKQDWLSTVVTVGEDGLSARVIGSLIDFLDVVEGHRPIIEAISRPQIRIVSLTVTEGGYYIDAMSGAFDERHPDIQLDRANKWAPRTAFGAIVAGLNKRRLLGGPPLTVLSCDNLPENGIATKNAVLGIALSIDGDLASWIRDNVSFPSGMVDRITPTTTDRERNIVLERFKLRDASPVFCEPYSKWVIEDQFIGGRPDLEAVGVTFTSNVRGYEEMKIRILNGGHAIIAYAAGLARIGHVHEAMNVAVIEAFLRKVIQNDVAPHIQVVAEQSPTQYLDETISRFKNPGTGDTIRRICFDGSNRMSKFTVPSIRDSLSTGSTPHGLALVSALWCHYCAGVDDDGGTISPNDPNWDALQKRAQASSTNPLIWLEMRSVYGDLRKSTEFCSAFECAWKLIRAQGSLFALREYVNS